MSKQLKKRPVQKELQFLASFELYGALMAAGLYFAAKFILDMDLGEKAFALYWVSLYPLLVFSAILLEGSFYWHNQLRRVKRQRAFSRMEIGRIYYRIKWINVLLLAAYLPVVVTAALAGAPLSGIIAGLFLYGMAVIEQINYFHIRLSYETVNGGLLIVEPLKQLFTGTGKRPQLRRDIDRYLRLAGPPSA